MESMNKIVDPQKTAAMMNNFQKENMKMGMTEEMSALLLHKHSDKVLNNSFSLYFITVVNDTLDDILDESGDEEEQDAIVTQVLDEIGIDISGKVRSTTLI